MINIVGTGLNQWDTGRKVKVTDSEATHVHFANPGDSKAVIMEIEGGETKIPDYLLRTGKALNAYAVLDGVTLESRAFAVRKRERPENYIYEDDQRNYIYKLIDDANKAIKNANDAAEEARKAAENCSGGGGVSPLFVTFKERDNIYYASQSSIDISNHIDDGGDVYLIVDDNTRLNIESASPIIAAFYDSTANTRYTIDQLGNGYITEVQPGGGSAEGVVMVDQGTDKAETLLYVGEDGKVSNVGIGDDIDIEMKPGKNIVHGEWCGGRYNTDGSFTIVTGNSYLSINEKYPVTPGGSYTLSIVSSSLSMLNAYVFEFDAAGNFIKENTEVKGDLVFYKGFRNFTVTENTELIGFFLYSANIPWQDIVPEGFMIEEGLTKTEYEPYGTKPVLVVSKYPKDVENAGTLLYVDDNGKLTNVAVGEGIDVSYGVGKNIVHGAWCAGRYAASGFTKLPDTSTSYLSIDKRYPVTPGGVYTVSIVSAKTSTLNVYVWEYDADGKLIGENVGVKGDLVSKGYRNFTVTENTAYIGFFLYFAGTLWKDMIPEGFMIESGSVKTEYEPYRLGYTMSAQKQIAEGITDYAYAEHAPSAAVRSIAHRGVPETAPECTAPSYILARKMGFTIAENDVQNTVDGKYVMWHDTSLSHCGNVWSLDGKELMTDTNGNRYWVTNGAAYTFDEASGTYTKTSVAVSTLSRVNGSTLVITEQTYAFLRNIDVGKWKNAIFGGTQMLSFEEWLDLCKVLGMECYVDNKTINTDEEAADLVAIARKKGMLRKCSWLGSMAQIRKADPKARCGILYAPTESNLAENGTYDKALKEGGEGSVFWNPPAADVTAENAELALSRGYGYECWYVLTSTVPTDTYYAEIERLLKCGCQGLTLDNHTAEDFMVYKYGNAMKK